MQTLIKSMLDKKVWAVVGATENTAKFGNKIYKKLKAYGYDVYAVNPTYKEVDGDTCYNSLSDVPVRIDCVNVVVGPDKSIRVLDEAKRLGIENIWFQPGTYTPDIVEASEVAGLKTVYINCVLVELG